MHYIHNGFPSDGALFTKPSGASLLVSFIWTSIHLHILICSFSHSQGFGFSLRFFYIFSCCCCCYYMYIFILCYLKLSRLHYIQFTIAIQFHHDVEINTMYIHSQSHTYRTMVAAMTKPTENAINSQASNNWASERTKRENHIKVKKQQQQQKS